MFEFDLDDLPAEQEREFDAACRESDCSPAELVEHAVSEFLRIHDGELEEGLPALEVQDPIARRSALAGIPWSDERPRPYPRGAGGSSLRVVR